MTSATGGRRLCFSPERDERSTDTGAAASARRRARRARGPGARGGRSGDQDGARVRRPVGELRVPRREERAGLARGAHPEAARAPRQRGARRRVGAQSGRGRDRLDRRDPPRGRHTYGNRNLQRDGSEERFSRVAARPRSPWTSRRRDRRGRRPARLVARRDPFDQDLTRSRAQSGQGAAVITAWAYSASRSSSWPRTCARNGKSSGETRRRANGATATGLANWGTRAV